MSRVKGWHRLAAGASAAVLACACGGGGGATPVENRPPDFVDPPGPGIVVVGAELTFTLRAVDPEGGTVTLRSRRIPANASFDPASGVFLFEPAADQVGQHEAVFAAADDATPPAERELRVAIEVSDANKVPVIAPIERLEWAEGDTVEFTVTATDPDGDEVSLRVRGLPVGASFDAATGAFQWVTHFDDAGTHEVGFTATDDGVPAASADLDVTLTIADVRRPPVVEPPDPVVVTEGATIDVAVTAHDPDGGEIITFAENVPPGAAYDDVARRFRWSTTFDDDGAYVVALVARQRRFPFLEGRADLDITVRPLNRAPAFGGPLDLTAREGETVTSILLARDPDGDEVTYTADGLPPFAELSGVLLTVRPGFTDAGTYGPITLQASDTGTPPLTDETTLRITVTDTNRAPVIALPAPPVVAENDPLTFTVTAADPDDGAVRPVAAEDVPSGASYDSGTFSWTPGFTQAGEHTVRFISADAADPAVRAEAHLVITVTDVNRPPRIVSPATSRVAEGTLRAFTLTVSDDDGDTVVVRSEDLPPFATLEGTLVTLTPGFGHAGDWPVHFTATDDGTPPLSTDATTVITVANVNRAPTVQAPADAAVREGETLRFTVSGGDPDGDAIALSAASLPAGASFDPATGAFAFTAEFDDAGTYDVTFTATEQDGDAPRATSTVTRITVANVNRPPAVVLPPALSVFEGATLEEAILASDPDGDAIVSYIGVDVPDFVTVDGAMLRATPGFDDAGEHLIDVTATDDGVPPETGSIRVTLTVFDVNRAPLLDAPVAVRVREGEEVAFAVGVSDPDGDIVALSVEDLPGGATFDAATGEFRFATGFTDAGEYAVSFFAIDDDPNAPRTAAATTTITVEDVNRAPRVTGLDDVRIAPGDVRVIPFQVTDPDAADTVTVELLDPPPFVTAEEVSPGEWRLTLAPEAEHEDTWAPTITATDNGLVPQQTSVTFTILVAPNRRPVWGAPPVDLSVAEGDDVVVALSVSDPDDDAITVVAQSVPAFCQLTSATGGGYELTCAPDHDDAGVYTGRLDATDLAGSGQTTSLDVHIAVVDQRQASFAGAVESRLAALPDSAVVRHDGRVLATTGTAIRVRQATDRDFGDDVVVPIVGVGATVLVDGGSALLAANDDGFWWSDQSGAPDAAPLTQVGGFAGVTVLAAGDFAARATECGDEVLAGVDAGDVVLLAPDCAAAAPRPYVEAGRVTGLCTGAVARLHVADFDEANPTLDALAVCATGAARFVASHSGTIGQGPASPVGGLRPILPVDVDGDGHVDIVDGSSGSSNLGLCIGHGDFTFDPPAGITVGARGLRDLVPGRRTAIGTEVLAAYAAQGAETQGSLRILAPDPTGPVVASVHWAPNSVRHAAWAGGGAVVTADGGEVLYLPETATGDLLGPVRLSSLVAGSIVADVDQDGAAEIAVFDGTQLTRHALSGRAAAAPADALPVGPGPVASVVAFDVHDSDDPAGHLAALHDAFTLGLYTRTGPSTWSDERLVLLAEASDVALGDLDGDGIADPMWAHADTVGARLSASGALRFAGDLTADPPVRLVPARFGAAAGAFILHQDGARTLRLETDALVEGARTTFATGIAYAATGDLDGDGQDDLVAALADGAFAVVSGATGAVVGDHAALGGMPAQALAVGFITADALPDVVAVDQDARVWLLPGDGAGTFGVAEPLDVLAGEHILTAPGASLDDLVVIDEDADGLRASRHVNVSAP